MHPEHNQSIMDKKHVGSAKQEASEIFELLTHVSFIFAHVY